MMVMMVVVVVALSLGYIPVHRLGVGRDHLVNRGVTSTSSVASKSGLVGPRWSQALGLEVPEGLGSQTDVPVGVGGG